MEKEILDWGWENLKLALEFQRQGQVHKEQTQKLKEKLATLEHLPAQREFKKRLFDLESFLNSAQSLFTTLDDEALLVSFLNLVQQQTNCKFGLVYALDEKKENWVIKQALGMDFKDSRHLNIPVSSKLATFLKTKPKPHNLLLATEELKRDPHVRNLLEGGVQLGVRLVSGGQFWGMVFLGEKVDHSQYQEQDLELFFILCQILNSAWENLKQFKKIEELSYTDSLTSLYNYRYFNKRLIEETLRAKRFNRTLGLVMFDIDGFKTYNDTYGHQAGDRVLRQLGGLLLTTTRSIDISSRYGGEEFCIIMPEADSQECLKFMERLRRAISHHPFKDEFLAFDHHITVSVGGAIFPADAKTVDKLIYCADMALLRAKNAGKNKAFLFHEAEAVTKR
jgi:diguanylate cyclase (GGDEF)-like protein